MIITTFHYVHVFNRSINYTNVSKFYMSQNYKYREIRKSFLLHSNTKRWIISWFVPYPGPCILFRRDSWWRGHIDFKPRANGQPPDPATNLFSLVGVGNDPANQSANLPTCQLTIHPTTATTYPPSPLLLPPLQRHREQAEASMIYSHSWCPAPDLACGWLVFNEYNAATDHIEYEKGKSTSTSAVPLLDATIPS